MPKDQTKEIYDVKGTVDAAQSCKVTHMCSLAKGTLKMKEENDALKAKKEETEKEFARLKADWEKAEKPELKLEILTRLSESIRIKEAERDLGIEKQRGMLIQAQLDAKEERINELRKELAEKRSLYEADPELRRVEHRITVLTKELKDKENEFTLKESNLNALDDHARDLTNKVENGRAVYKDLYRKVQTRREELRKLEKQCGRLSKLLDKPAGKMGNGQKPRNPFKRLWTKIRRLEE